MAQSLAKVYLHVIFSTKDRAACLSRETCRDLEAYLSKRLEALKCLPVMIGVQPDHLHALCCLGRSIMIEELIKQMKSSSSKLIKSRNEVSSDFHWQAGYGVFSVSSSQLQKVRRYIEGQEEHHRVKSYQEEFREFLKAYNVEFDERYVWD